MVRITNKPDSIVFTGVCLGLMATFYALLSVVFLSLIESNFNDRITKLMPANVCFIVELIMSSIFVGLLLHTIFEGLFIRYVFLIGAGVFIRWVEIAGIQHGKFLTLTIADIHKISITEIKYKRKVTQTRYEVSCNYNDEVIWLSTFWTEPEAENFVNALSSSNQGVKKSETLKTAM